MKRWLYYVLIVVFAAVFLYCAISLGSYFLQSKQTQDGYDALSDLLQQSPSTVPNITVDPTDPSATEPSPYVTVLHPETQEPVEMLPEFTELFKLNPHLVGWISIEDTNVNYPVVQTAQDNADYYLYRNYYKENDAHGCIYVREQCDVFKPSDNITIYGHRMKDHTMFGHLAKYERKEFWQDHQFIQFNTLKAHHTYQIVTVFTTTANLGEGFQYHLYEDFLDEAECNEFLTTAKANALYDTGLSAAYGDKFITLSTCEYTKENGRLVILAKQIS